VQRDPGQPHDAVPHSAARDRQRGREDDLPDRGKRADLGREVAPQE
jgi:hypothetical protein